MEWNGYGGGARRNTTIGTMVTPFRGDEIDPNNGTGENCMLYWVLRQRR